MSCACLLLIFFKGKQRSGEFKRLRLRQAVHSADNPLGSKEPLELVVRGTGEPSEDSFKALCAHSVMETRPASPLKGGLLLPGEPINQWDFSELFQEVIQDLEIRHRDFYHTRQTFISGMLTHGENPQRIAEYVGNSRK